MLTRLEYCPTWPPTTCNRSSRVSSDGISLSRGTASIVWPSPSRSSSRECATTGARRARRRGRRAETAARVRVRSVNVAASSMRSAIAAVRCWPADPNTRRSRAVERDRRGRRDAGRRASARARRSDGALLRERARRARRRASSARRRACSSSARERARLADLVAQSARTRSSIDADPRAPLAPQQRAVLGERAAPTPRRSRRSSRRRARASRSAAFRAPARARYR